MADSGTQASGFSFRALLSLGFLMTMPACEFGKAQIRNYKVNGVSQNLSSSDTPATAAPNLTTTALTLNAQSISMNIHSGHTYTFSALDGTAPFTFSILSGTGSINASTGVFTAGTKVEDTSIQVVDATGRKGTATVKHYYMPVNGQIRAMVMDSAGNKYIGGIFNAAYPYAARNMIALKTNDGSPELSLDIAGGFNGAIYTMVRGPNGEFYVGGEFTSYKGLAANRIAKLDKYGTLDQSFHPNDAAGGFDQNVMALALDSTGTTLYVGGWFNSYRGVSDSAHYIAKLSTSDGAIDTNFHPVSSSGGFDDYVNSLAINATGTTLYVGGDFTTYRGVANSANRIAKLSTSDGAIDTSFHPVSATGGFDSGVYTLTLNSTGTTLYVGGDFTTYRGVANSANRIAKLSTSNGAIDTTFHPISPTGGFENTVQSLALNATGTTLYVGGYFSTYRGVDDSAHSIAKLSTSNGAIDTTFHPISPTGGFDESVNTLALDSTGTILYVGGSFISYRGVAYSANRIAKLYTSNGAIDTSLQPVSSTSTFHHTEYDPFVNTLVLDPNNPTIYVGGGFSSYRGQANSANYIAKLSGIDGAIDTTFHPVSASGGFDYYVETLAINSTGTTLYVGGSFSTYRGVPNSAMRIAKLSTSNGAIDTSFHPTSVPGGFNNSVKALALNAAGTTLYVGGAFIMYRGVTNSAKGIAKLSTSNGAIDTSFHPVSANGGFTSYTMDGVVQALVLDPTGSYLYVGGYFNTYRGVQNSAMRIAKLSTINGAIDSTFHPVSASGGFNSFVYALALNSTGTILYVGGSFTTYRGVADSANRIAKLSTSNGTIDTNFHPISTSGGFDNSVASLALDPSETVLYAGGEFRSYRGVVSSAGGIAKISTNNGNIDTTFHPAATSSGFSGNVSSIVLNSNGTELTCGGVLGNYEGNLSPNIATLRTANGELLSPY